ncbi:MAG: nucleotide exchange factor GrpE [Holosporales bacterium]|jgi:molecular chaperone GrpE|nr:nucleotide exchange factor GrpE [Holosporales bacterium]
MVDQEEDIEKSESANCNAGDENLAEKVASLEDRLLRAIAESQNVQRRADREKLDAIKYGISEFARDILSVRDNLLRAIESCQQEQPNPVVDGVKLTLAEMDKVLTRHNVTVFESSGTTFDPHLHQAITEVEDNDSAPGTIVKVLQEGFMLRDRLLRPALVCISKKCN